MAEQLSLVAALLALLVALYTWRHQSFATAYGDLDSLYFTLHQKAMDYPFVTDPNFTWNYKDQDDALKRLVYHRFAYQSWMVCESIYDRTRHSSSHFDTWEPVIYNEARLHLRWFLDEAQSKSYKKRFRDYIKKVYEPQMEQLRADAMLIAPATCAVLHGQEAKHEPRALPDATPATRDRSDLIPSTDSRKREDVLSIILAMIAGGLLVICGSRIARR